MNNSKNKGNNNTNKSKGKKYQISGMTENYTYDAGQGLAFDPTSISTSGHASNTGVSEAVVNQQMFSSDYNQYKNQSTFLSFELI